MAKSIGATIGELLKLNLQLMVKGYYFFTIGAVFIGSVSAYFVYNIGDKINIVEDELFARYVVTQEAALEAANIQSVLAAASGASGAELKTVVESVKKRSNEGPLFATSRITSGLAGDDKGSAISVNVGNRSSAYFDALNATSPSVAEIGKTLAAFGASIEEARAFHDNAMDEGFGAADIATLLALLVVIGLTLGAIVGMIFSAIILSDVVGTPVSNVTDELLVNSKSIEEVYSEISIGTKKQTDVVKAATKDLEDMIINTIQGNISMSVEKQVVIAKSFSDFLKQFVERTSAEIAMGMMSIAQQSAEARKGVETFVAELAVVEDNIKTQQSTIDGVVGALKAMVEANREIRAKAITSTEAADKATNAAYAGQERIGVIAHELEEIKNASQGVKDITESLAKITENIKILALNMSLKVEDIKDDTGKSYGFEAMSTRVQSLAEEVEGLLIRSTEIINPTLDAIEKVDIEARDTLVLLEDVANTIKIADEESKAIGSQIDKQAAEIDRVEVEAENLKAIAEKTTLSIVAQSVLIKEVDELLKESEVLIETVNTQTLEASDSARKVNDLMKQLVQSVKSIEDGTGVLTEKSAMLSEMFDTIHEQAMKNLNGAEKLEGATNAVRNVSNQLSVVVRGNSAG